MSEVLGKPSSNWIKHRHGCACNGFVFVSILMVDLTFYASSETQGQIVGVRESLNGRKNMTQRKVKNDEKSPWGQCLTRPVPNGRYHPGFWLVPENFCLFLPNGRTPEQRQPFGIGLVRHCPQGLHSPFFTLLLRAIFFHPFRLSLAPTICPWVSEDAFYDYLTFFFAISTYPAGTKNFWQVRSLKWVLKKMWSCKSCEMSDPVKRSFNLIISRVFFLFDSCIKSIRPSNSFHHKNISVLRLCSVD